MISDLRRRIHAAAMQAGGKECWTITDTAELAVRNGDDLDEVLRQIEVSCPDLFHPRKNRERKNQKRPAKTVEPY